MIRIFNDLPIYQGNVFVQTNSTENSYKINLIERSLNK